MLKFTIDAKDFKTITQKVLSAAPKKAALPILECIKMTIKDDVLTLSGTNLENFINVKTDRIYNTVNGQIAIHKDDIQILNKLIGDITIIETESNIIIQNGNKKMTIPLYSVLDCPEIPVLKEEIFMLSCKESWFFETLSNLSIFTSKNDTRPILRTFNFNLKNKRVEALDGLRIAIRKMNDEVIINEGETNITIPYPCFDIGKKVFDKKSESIVSIYKDNKYIKIIGENFELIQRKIEGEYFNLDRVLPGENDYDFEIAGSVSNLNSILKYDTDILKGSNIPVVWHSINRDLYVYTKTQRYELLDKIETVSNTMDDKLYISFNPMFITDVLSVVDTEEYVIRGKKSISPIMIYGNEYTFLILPIRSDTGREEQMINCINKTNVA